MATLKCSDCGHTWDTRDRLEETQDPKCGECHSRDYDVVEDDPDHADKTLREALKPLDIDAEYVTQFFDATDDDAERLRDLLIEAGADSKRATRAAEWYFRQTEREINVPERQRAAGRRATGQVDPDEIAERVERRMKPQTQQVDSDESDDPNPLTKARDKAAEQAGEQAGDAVADALDRIANQLGGGRKLVEQAILIWMDENPEKTAELIDAFGGLGGLLDFLSDHGLLDAAGTAATGGEGAGPTADVGRAMDTLTDHMEREMDTETDPTMDRTRKARERAEQSDGEAPPPVTADDETERESGESGGDDTEEIAEDFTEVA